MIRAFNGSPGSLVRLPGGQGGSWRAGGVVLKRAELDSAAPWLGPALQSMPSDPAFRLARPLASRRGTWTVQGWEATEWLAGRHEPGRWRDAIAVSEAFHRAVREHVAERPAAIASSSAWGVGDRVAWREGDPGPVHPLAAVTLARLGPLLVAYRAVASARLSTSDPDRAAAEIDGYRPVLALLGIAGLT